MDTDLLFLEGLRHHMGGRIDVAEEIYKGILDQNPEHPDALHHIGLIHLQSGLVSQAIREIQASILLDKSNSSAMSNLGYCFNLVGDFLKASESCKASLDLNPNDDGAWTNLGNAQRGLKLFAEAGYSYERALSLCPSNPRYMHNVGLALFDQDEFDKAKGYFQKCLAVEPNIAEAHNNLAACLLRLHDPWNALFHTDKAIQAIPNYLPAWSNRGVALNELKRYDEALSNLDRLLEIKPDHAEAWSNRGVALNELKRHEQALASFERSEEIKPTAVNTLGDLVHTQLRICNWDNLERRCQSIKTGLLTGNRVTTPFALLGLFDDPQLQRRCAEFFANKKLRLKRPRGPISKGARKGKLRIGYFSADFYNHATMNLIAQLFECHDRSKFEVYGFSFGPIRKDQMRRRAEEGMDVFFEVSSLSDADVAALARAQEIDIAVDLKGYTADSRPAIFAHRAAPIQVSYLGFPGTMGTTAIDYLIADPDVIPKEMQPAYSEKIIYLPNSYQVNNSRREISPRRFSRNELGLPETGFVFCCFNNSWKLLPEIFDVWVRIIQSVPDSVLWLYEDNPTATCNLKAQAKNKSLDPERLVFAKPLPHPEHLARYQLADLFLDTFPYGAHTTASEALWAGLPVLTRSGLSFASRVAGSLLRAVGLPELITETPQAYESWAIELAKCPEKISSLRARLANNRENSSLFNTALFTENLESGYRLAYERYCDGLDPEHIYVRN